MRHSSTAPQGELWLNRWERIGSRALDRDRVFTNLLTHINVETLREGFQALDGTKATGIDGITRHMPEPKQTLRSPVREIRMRGSERVLPPPYYGNKRR